MTSTSSLSLFAVFERKMQRIRAGCSIFFLNEIKDEKSLVVNLSVSSNSMAILFGEFFVNAHFKMIEIRAVFAFR